MISDQLVSLGRSSQKRGFTDRWGLVFHRVRCPIAQESLDHSPRPTKPRVRFYMLKTLRPAEAKADLSRGAPRAPRPPMLPIPELGAWPIAAGAEPAIGPALGAREPRGC